MNERTITRLSDFDKQAAKLGDQRYDNERGDALMTGLEEAWFSQGVNACQMGLTPDSFWNDFQRAGYRAWGAVQTALAEVRAQ